MDFNFKNFNPRNLFANANVNFKKPELNGDFFREYSSLLWEIFFLFLILLYLIYFLFIAPPSDFPLGVVIHVEKGETLNDVISDLKSNGVIKSGLAFRMGVEFFGDEKNIIAGDYYFEDRIKVTVYEGLTAEEMGEVLEKKFTEFDAKEFADIVEKRSLEGYLFPDTYFFLPNIKAEGVVQAMEMNFYTRMTEIQDKIANSGKNLHEIVTMASILEEEARTLNSKKMISGILWHRIEIEMPLQVDAVFPYIIGKNTYNITKEELKTDSPYNTYLYKGLPPGPIANPGMNSILAAIEPIENDYIFYLSDRRGNMYYAKDYETHKLNINLYLRN